MTERDNNIENLFRLAEYPSSSDEDNNVIRPTATVGWHQQQSHQIRQVSDEVISLDESPLSILSSPSAGEHFVESIPTPSTIDQRSEQARLENNLFWPGICDSQRCNGWVLSSNRPVGFSTRPAPPGYGVGNPSGSVGIDIRQPLFGQRASMPATRVPVSDARATMFLAVPELRNPQLPPSATADILGIMAFKRLQRYRTLRRNRASSSVGTSMINDMADGAGTSAQPHLTNQSGLPPPPGLHYQSGLIRPPGLQYQPGLQRQPVQQHQPVLQHQPDLENQLEVDAGVVQNVTEGNDNIRSGDELQSARLSPRLPAQVQVAPTNSNNMEVDDVTAASSQQYLAGHGNEGSEEDSAGPAALGASAAPAAHAASAAPATQAFLVSSAAPAGHAASGAPAAQTVFVAPAGPAGPAGFVDPAALVVPAAAAALAVLTAPGGFIHAAGNINNTPNDLSGAISGRLYIDIRKKTRGHKRRRECERNRNEAFTVKELNQNLLRLLECPVCLEWMEPPMLQCRLGHLICARCRARLSTCPVCRSGFSSVRNRAMEGVADLLRYPCRHGCGRETRLRRRVGHESSCPRRRYNCPAHTCAERTPHPYDELVRHIQRSHAAMIKTGPIHKFSVKVNAEQLDNWLIMAGFGLFHLRIDVEIRTWSILAYVAYIGPKCKAKDFTYEVTIIGQHNGRKLVYTRATHSDLESSSLNASRQDCFHITLDEAINYLRFRNKHCQPDRLLDFTVEITQQEVPNTDNSNNSTNSTISDE